jgi:Eukaryotic aspartyl protease
MKNSISSIVLTSLSLTELSLASSTFRIDITKLAEEKAQILRRDNSVTAALTNGKIFYYTNVTVGTPGQQLALQIDTGSSDVWMPSISSPGCISGSCAYGSCKSLLQFLVLSAFVAPNTFAKTYISAQSTPTNLPRTLLVRKRNSKSYIVMERVP